MDFIITFFRDILDGPLYITVAVISGILICSCIGYLAERSIMKKNAKKQYDAEHFNVDKNVTNETSKEVDEVTITNTPNLQEPMETVQIENNMDTHSNQQAIPEMTSIPDSISNQKNIDK